MPEPLQHHFVVYGQNIDGRYVFTISDAWPADADQPVWDDDAGKWRHVTEVEQAIADDERLITILENVIATYNRSLLTTSTPTVDDFAGPSKKFCQLCLQERK